MQTIKTFIKDHPPYVVGPVSARCIWGGFFPC